MQPEYWDCEESLVHEPRGRDRLMRPSHQRTRQSCRVLVVDDDELVRSRLASALRSADYEVEVADDGRDALRVLGARPCDIILTDWLMPVIDGLDLCRHVRSIERDRYTYLILFTVRRAHDDLLSGFAAGVDDYVVKGASIEEVLSRLETGRRIIQRAARPGDVQPRELPTPPVVSAEYDSSYLMKNLRREFARAERYSHPLSVLRCEIDGVDGGNALILSDLTTLAETSVRKSDWLARTYENEFMLVLPETAFAGARRVASRLQELIAFRLLSFPGGENFKASIEGITVKPSINPGDRAILDSLLRSVERRQCATALDRRRPDESSIAARQAPTVVAEDSESGLH